jgi:hypothetical protein
MYFPDPKSSLLKTIKCALFRSCTGRRPRSEMCECEWGDEGMPREEEWVTCAAAGQCLEVVAEKSLNAGAADRSAARVQVDRNRRL